MPNFSPNYTYTFSKDKFLTSGGNAMYYKANPMLRSRVDKMDKHPVNVIDGRGMCNGYGVEVEWCDAIRMTYLRRLVKAVANKIYGGGVDG